MKFSVNLSSEPNEHYVPLAQAAEAAGFDAITLPDSICFPRESISKYPYNEDGSSTFLEGLPFIDPFIQIARLSAVTEQIRFTTAVVKLAVRQPVIVAKMLSSLAVVSDNREDAYTPAGIEKLGKAGVDLVYIGLFNVYAGRPDGRTLAQKLTQIKRFAKGVIAPSRS